MTTNESIHKTKEEVAGKVRKLLAQAEDPAATAEEAQAFTMKAQQLMTKYSIELAMVADAANADQVVDRGWTVYGPYAGHKITMISAVARANDCRAIFTNLTQGRKHIEVVGYPGDVEWVQTLARSLEIQLAGGLAAAMASKPPRVHGRTYAVGFIQGFISEVSKRLQQARRDAVAAAQAARDDERHEAAREAIESSLGVASAASSVALVLVAKRERVEEEFRVRHPSARTVYNQVRLQSWSGYEPGREAGRRASLARGSVGNARGSLSA